MRARAGAMCEHSHPLNCAAKAAVCVLCERGSRSLPAAATSSESLEGMRLEEANATREPSDSRPLLSVVPSPVFATHNQNYHHHNHHVKLECVLAERRANVSKCCLGLPE